MMSLDIKYETEKHTTLREAVLERKKFSERKMLCFRSQWDDADDSLKAYIPETELDKKKKHDKKQLGKVDYVTLEVPYVYAQVMTAHTYWATIFLSCQPVWQFTARHGEGQDAVMAVEAVMDYQLQVGNQLPVLYKLAVRPGQIFPRSCWRLLGFPGADCHPDCGRAPNAAGSKDRRDQAGSERDSRSRV